MDDDTLKIDPDDWLPRSLIVNAFRVYGSTPGWELKTAPNHQPTVDLTLTDAAPVFADRSTSAARVWIRSMSK